MVACDLVIRKYIKRFMDCNQKGAAQELRFDYLHLQSRIAIFAVHTWLRMVAMRQKNRPGAGNTKLVYSTSPGGSPDQENETPETLAEKQPQLSIQLEKKGRRGKTVTIIGGFVGTPDELKELSRLLKTQCGVGGSAKDSVILIQGNFLEKVSQILTAAGFKLKPAGQKS